MLTQAEKEARRQGIGSSDLPVIAGLTPEGWRRPIDIFIDKRPDLAHKVAKEELRPVDESVPLLRGSFLEGGCGAWYEHKTKQRLTRGILIRHPKNPIAIASPDFEIQEKRKLVEIKTSFDFSKKAEWGEAGTDLVPDYYIAQVQWQLYCKGWDIADLAAFRGDDLDIYPIEADKELQKYFAHVADEWWNTYVVPGVPPPPDGSQQYARYIKQRYPEDSGPMMASNPVIDGLMDKLKVIVDRTSELEKKEKELRQALQLIIGDAEGVEGNGWKISYRSQTNSHFDLARLCQTYGIDEPTLETFRKPPTRSFKPTWKKIK